MRSVTGDPSWRFTLRSDESDAGLRFRHASTRSTTRDSVISVPWADGTYDRFQTPTSGSLAFPGTFDRPGPAWTPSAMVCSALRGEGVTTSVHPLPGESLRAETPLTPPGSMTERLLQGCSKIAPPSSSLLVSSPGLHRTSAEAGRSSRRHRCHRRGAFGARGTTPNTRSDLAVSHRLAGLLHQKVAGLLHPAADPGVHRVSARTCGSCPGRPRRCLALQSFPHSPSRTHVTMGRCPPDVPACVPVWPGAAAFRALLRASVRCRRTPLPTSEARCSPGLPVLELPRPPSARPRRPRPPPKGPLGRLTALDRASARGFLTSTGSRPDEGSSGASARYAHHVSAGTRRLAAARSQTPGTAPKGPEGTDSAGVPDQAGPRAIATGSPQRATSWHRHLLLHVHPGGLRRQAPVTREPASRDVSVGERAPSTSEGSPAHAGHRPAGLRPWHRAGAIPHRVPSHPQSGRFDRAPRRRLSPPTRARLPDSSRPDVTAEVAFRSSSPGFPPVTPPRSSDRQAARHPPPEGGRSTRRLSQAGRRSAVPPSSPTSPAADGSSATASLAAPREESGRAHV